MQNNTVITEGEGHYNIRIGELGYVVEVAYAKGHVVIATSPTGETWTVRGPDLHEAACELAQQVGVELEGG